MQYLSIIDFELAVFLISGLICSIKQTKVMFAVFGYFTAFQIISMFDLYQVGIFHYMNAALIDFLIFQIAIKYRANMLMLITLSGSILYNALSFIEFRTQYSVFYSNYSLVMSVLSVLLLFGAMYGRFSIFNWLGYSRNRNRGGVFFFRART